MAGIPVSAISNSPSQAYEVRVRIANTTTANYTALASGANGTTRLGLVFPEETIVEHVGFLPDVKAGSTATFSLGVAGSWNQANGPDGGTFGSATLPSGAMADANRMTEAVDLSGSGFTAGTYKPLQIHKSSGTNTSTASKLNNNVVPPGGQIYAHTSEDVAAITFSGVLVFRVRTKAR